MLTNGSKLEEGAVAGPPLLPFDRWSENQPFAWLNFPNIIILQRSFVQRATNPLVVFDLAYLAPGTGFRQSLTLLLFFLISLSLPDRSAVWEEPLSSLYCGKGTKTDRGWTWWGITWTLFWVFYLLVQTKTGGFSSIVNVFLKPLTALI